MIKKILHRLTLLGLDLSEAFYFFRGIPSYISDYRKLKTQLKNSKEFHLGTPYPQLRDKYMENGNLNSPYFQQDILVAKKIYQHNPIKHVDIGSRIDGFVAHVAVFREIEVFDIRPQNRQIVNIKFLQADMMQLSQSLQNYCDSLSSLHAIEHFGLGRYGDPIDANGHIKALDNIYKILKPQGKFYFSTPIGSPQRIEFNAHRVFDMNYLISLFKNKFYIEEICYINDKGDLFEHISLSDKNIKKNFDCRFGCGIFELIKI